MKRLLIAALAAGVALPAMAKDKPPVIAITVDDLPTHGPLPPGMTRIGIARQMIAALKQGGAAPVHGFVNAAGSEREPDAAPVLALWRQVGMPLGNHTWSHADLDKVGADAFIDEIAHGETALGAFLDADNGRWFRFPYLDEGKDPTARLDVRKALAARGYHIAAVTMSFGDFLWNSAYPRCVAQRDEKAIAWLEQSYLAAASEAARRSQAESRAVHGRDIPYVLLMHIGAFSAHMLPRLIAQYRAEGFGFTTLPQAESDPAYAADMDPSLPPRPSLDEEARGSAGLPPVHNYAAELAAICPAPAAG